MENKIWEVLVLKTNKRYRLAEMNFEKEYIGIHTDEPIKTQYSYEEVKVFHGDIEVGAFNGK